MEMRGGTGYVEEFATPRLLRDAHLGSIWEGTTSIVALDAVTRAVRRHSAEAALASELHARLDEAKALPEAYADRLRALVDRAIAFARLVAGDPARESDARRATSGLYHAASAVLLAWEGARTHERRGDARRLVLSRLVVDHRLSARDPLAVDAGPMEERASTLLLNDDPISLTEAAAFAAAGES
jgi:hypothetical protein